MVGIIMLDTAFPRPPGDIGHPDSFSVPVLYRRVENASAEQAVRGDADALLAPFIAAAHELVAEGATVIGTSCGFLSLLQQQMQEALSVPVVTSSLTLVQQLGSGTGILTIDAEALTDRHMNAAGIDWQVPTVGLPKTGELATVIFEDKPALDVAKVEAEMVAAAQKLVGDTPSLTGIVFECTNMGPYRSAVSEAVGLPVFTVIDAIEGALP